MPCCLNADLIISKHKAVCQAVPSCSFVGYQPERELGGDY